MRQHSFTLTKSTTTTKMKILTLNFLTCAIKACKSSSQSFPLHPKDAELVQDTIELNPKLLINILPRIDWNALIITSSEVRSPYSRIWLQFTMPTNTGADFNRTNSSASQTSRLHPQQQKSSRPTKRCRESYIHC